MRQKTKIAINGFGRIGRAALRIALTHAEVEVAAINDPGDTATLAHLIKYDSVYGVLAHSLKVDGDNLIIDGKTIVVTHDREPENLPWGGLGVEVVLECTGAFKTYDEAARHLKAGAKKVVISAPSKDDQVKTFLFGTNHKDYNGEVVISMGSCTTNCIAPVMKVMGDVFGVEKSLMTTIHAYTSTQNLVDNKHKDLRRARAAAINIIPASTGAAVATTKVIPELAGHFDGMALRVPIPTGSISDIVVLTKKETTVEEVNQALTQAAQGDFKGIMDVTKEPLGSSDFIGNPFCSIVDLELTKVVGGNLVKIIAWYDNEWGYSSKLVDLVALVAE